MGWLASLIPQIDILRARILLPIAGTYRHRKLVKSAIKSDIRGHVNHEISKFKTYLPAGWASEMDIDWVKMDGPASLVDDDRIIIRIHPVENQDYNFVNAAYHYLKTSFFPKTQAVIPKPHYEASVLHVCRKKAEGRSSASKVTFEDQILEPAIQRHKQIPTYLEDYGYLDSRGFFTGTFLRELHLAATEARFNSGRDNVGADASGMVKHIKDFINAFGTEDRIPEAAWKNSGNVTNYAILLVANPDKIANGINAYVSRAESHFNSGAKRIYVFGSNRESEFANAVIGGISAQVTEIKLIEKYNTPFDYRGEKGGVGAVFEIAQTRTV